MATDNKGLRGWAAALALGLALAGPQSVGVAAADRGEAGGAPSAAGESSDEVGADQQSQEEPGSEVKDPDDGELASPEDELPGDVKIDDKNGGEEPGFTAEETSPEPVAVELEPELTPEPKIHIDPFYEEPPTGELGDTVGDENSSPETDETGTDDTGTEDTGTEETTTEETTTDDTGTEETTTDDTGTEDTGTEETTTDDTGTGTEETTTEETTTVDTGTEETTTEETTTEDTGTEETTTDDTGTEDTGTEDTGTEETTTNESASIETVGEGPEPLRPEPLWWWRTTALTGESGEDSYTEASVSLEGGAPTEWPGAEWYYDSPPDSPSIGEGWADANTTDSPATTSPPLIKTTNKADSGNNQAIDSLKVRVVEFLDQISELLSSLPANPFSDYLSGALLLLRRALQTETLVRSDSDSGTYLDVPEAASPSGLVGLTEDEAMRVAEASGLVSRVVSRDGEQFAITKDYRLSRVNLTVNDGVVTAVYVG